MGNLDQPPFPKESTLHRVWQIPNINEIEFQIDLVLRQAKGSAPLYDPTLKHQWGYFGKD